MESPKRGLRGKTLALKRRTAIIVISCDVEASLGARACIQVLDSFAFKKTRRFAFALLSPPKVLKDLIL